MRACISEATTLPQTFADDVATYAAGGCPAMEVWLTKLEQHLEKHSAEDTRRLLDEHGMTLAAASYQGGLLLSQGEQRRAHFDHFRRRLDLCQRFAIPTLLLTADFVGAVDQTALERAVISLKQAAQWAAIATPRAVAITSSMTTPRRWGRRTRSRSHGRRSKPIVGDHTRNHAEGPAPNHHTVRARARILTPYRRRPGGQFSRVADTGGLLRAGIMRPYTYGRSRS